MIEAELFEHLRTTVASVCGRVYPQIMPQDCSKPALVYTVVFDGDVQSVNGCVVSNNTRLQVDVYSDAYLESKTVKDEVKSSLYDFKFYPVDLFTVDIFEEETELFRQKIEFEIRN